MKKSLLVVWACLAIAVVLYIYNCEQQKVVVVNTPQPTPVATAQQVSQVSGNQAENYGDFLNISDISRAMIGKHNVSVVGRIVDLEERKKGNIFTWVKDLNGEQKLKVILWGKTIKKNPEYRDIFLDCWRSQKAVFLKGMVDEYKGVLELKAFEVYKQ